MGGSALRRPLKSPWHNSDQTCPRTKPKQMRLEITQRRAHWPWAPVLIVVLAVGHLPRKQAVAHVPSRVAASRRAPLTRAPRVFLLARAEQTKRMVRFRNNRESPLVGLVRLGLGAIGTGVAPREAVFAAVRARPVALTHVAAPAVRLRRSGRAAPIALELLRKHVRLAVRARPVALQLDFVRRHVAVVGIAVALRPRFGRAAPEALELARKHVRLASWARPIALQLASVRRRVGVALRQRFGRVAPSRAAGVVGRSVRCRKERHAAAHAES